MSKSLAPDQAHISAWLQDQIARILGRFAHEIDLDTAFGDFGLDSVTALDILGGLEDLLGRELPPTLLVKHNTCRKLAAHLARR